MSASRRDFLAGAVAGALSTLSARARADQPSGSAPPSGTSPAAANPASAPPNPQPSLAPASPPAFGTSPEVGPRVAAQDLAAAERLVWIEMTEAERAQAAGNWRASMAALHERRSGPRKVALEDGLAPGTVWSPAAIVDRAERDRSPPPGPAEQRQIARAQQPALWQPLLKGDGPALPADDASIAFAPAHQLARWLRAKKIGSERLTRIYLERMKRFQPQLNCVITLCEERALAQARAADAEIAKGRWRGPLHGVPYGVKDLLDTAGIATTYGAEPFRDRVPAKNAAVIDRLDAAGAVMLAKLSLGALALNDVWFGGRTNNPWCLEEGSSGSSAGPGSAVSAGLCAFAIGSETGGSIVSPSMRCGITGLRPTFGRVSRAGAMTLCWSLDKLGPMARSVEDTRLVLAAIEGFDANDASSARAPRDIFDHVDITTLKLGLFPGWMREAPATPVDLDALERLKKLGLQPIEVSLPDWPYDDLDLILFAEAAASFEELTLSRKVDQLKMQVADAWPNSFRQARFLSAVDFVQADRFRRKVAREMARIFDQVDLLLVPSLRDEMLTISNFTGHPSLTLRCGFIEIDRARSDWAPDPARPLPTFSPPRRVPHGVTLLGRLHDEATLCAAGAALEKACDVWSERPPGF